MFAAAPEDVRIFIPPVDVPQKPPADAVITTLSGQAFGTSWQVKAVLGLGDVADAQTRIEACLSEIDHQMSPYKPQSDLCRFNAAGSWQHVTLPPMLLDVVAKAVEVAQLTDGAFDPCLLEAVETWGFGSRVVDTGLPPEPVRDGLKARASDWRDLVVQDDGLIHPESLRLDLNAIAKGYAVDCVVDLLRNEFGVISALVEIGGELKGIGARPDGQPWWVEIDRVPGAGVGRNLIALCDHAVAVSGDWRRYFVHDDKSYAHTIDPITGCPLDNRMAGAVVMDKDCWRADALATALMVMGADRAMAFCAQHGVAALIMVRDGEHIIERLSPLMAAYGTDE
ncbi:FAD:protein FMN transferase [Asticcacaulis machinosus]|uniref:FAD:protein FMN transferase n=1 Tax=Asticcacaulis machinosus TaxID=2984211 RepID=A0ABT5HJL8_9CAUL|nr:FAD:protein FMN transferase [Asticcacaulis machinosus]MDC7676408.1 FAD:protein FMN transferase [Asticcacaulis machinosus]